MPDPASDRRVRCEWAGSEPEMLEYHDREWGVPLHDDRALFELLTLEGAQAGLSWRTVLLRRDGYRRAFEGFDLERIAALTEADVERLVLDEGIIRHRGKIESTISNAGIAIEIQREAGSLDRYLWGFVGGARRRNTYRALSDLPATTDESEAMSKDLRRHGMRFVGPTICYAFMQAAGLVNDHTVDCFRYDEV